MKKILIFIFWALSISSYSQGTKFFEGSWADALAKAEKENKLIFVDVSTTWCHPCKKMKKEILTQKKVGDFLNSNFVNLSINAYEIDGLEFALFYKVNSYPTFLFIDKKGNVVYKFFGFKMADQLINLSKKALKYYNISDELQKEYNAGKRNYSFIIKYINTLDKQDKPSDFLAEEFLSKNKVREELRLKFIYRTMNTTRGVFFNEMIDNLAKVRSYFKPEEVDEKIYNLFKKDIKNYTNSGDKKIVKKVLKSVKKIDFLSYDEFKMYSKLIKAKKKGKYKKYVSYAKKYFELLKTDKRKREFIKSLYLIKVKGEEMKNLACELAEDLYKSSKTKENRIELIKIFVLTGHFAEAEKQLKQAYKNPEKSVRIQLRNYSNYMIRKKGANFKFQ